MRHWQWAVVGLGLAILGAGAPPAIAQSNAPSLSVIVSDGHGCRWLRLDPAAHTTKTIATFSHAKDGATVAWAPRGDRALVWFDSRKADHGARPEIDEVTIATGQHHALPLPPLAPGDALSRVSYDQSGREVALVLHTPPVQHDKHGAFLSDNGHRYAIPDGQDGLPAIARAFAYTSAGRWTLLQNVFTTTGWDYGQDIDALAIAKQLTPDSTQRLHERIGEAVTDHAILARLHAFAPGLSSDDGEWHQAADTAHPAFVWEESGEFLEATGRLAVMGPRGVKTPSGMDLDPKEQALYDVREPYLLVTSIFGERTRLFDLRGPSRLYASNDAVAACFWP